MALVSVQVIYDPDPNPKNEEQAIARSHRIGQTREVRRGTLCQQWFPAPFLWHAEHQMVRTKGLSVLSD